jgi:nucleotide-binding universal stress UspA family protein
MALVSRILVPVEFSSGCRCAAQYAEALACHFRCEMILLHVVALPLSTWSPADSLAYSSVADFMPETVTERKAKLEAFLAGETAGISVERVVAQGDPAREIVACANSRHADLIVMPTHGHGPFRRLLLGSVTAKVLHDASCPVWTGPHLEQAPAHASIRFRNILCAIDLGPHARDVLAWAAHFAQDFAAELTLLHVLPMSLVRQEGIYFDPEWRQREAADTAHRIAEFQQEMHTNAEVMVETGETPETVADVAQQRDADLLVIGRGRHSGILGRLRTNAYAILRESPCPVATI